MRGITRVLVPLLAIAIFLVADRLAGNYFHQIDRQRRAESTKESYLIYLEEKEIRIQHPVYHHDLKPNERRRTQWGPLRQHVITNNLGFRDASNRVVPLASDQYRVLLIGDSFAEGQGVEYGASFAGLLAQRLADQKIEVHNASAGSFSPIIYFRKIKHLIETVGLEFDEVIVFLDISDIQNEVEFYLDKDLNVKQHGKMDERALPPDEKDPRFSDWETNWARKSIMVRAFFELKRKLTQEQTDLDLAINGSYVLSAWTLDESVLKSYGFVGLSKARKNMDRLLALLRARNISLSLAVYPWPYQIAHRDLESKQVAFWRAWCEQRKVSFVNFFPAFINDTVSTDEVIKRYYIRGDSHWNAEGHALIADELLAQWQPKTSPKL